MLAGVVKEYQDIFVSRNWSKGRFALVQDNIETDDARNRSQKLPLAKREEEEKGQV